MELTYRIIGHLILFCYFLRSSQAITPVFTAYTPSPITEGLPPGSFYYKFVASHAVSYSFDAKASEWFNINSAGYATVKKTIDREMMGNPFRYKVRASDGSLTGEADVIQQITDINDNPPNFINLPMTINISEDLAVGALVYQLSADDKDEVPANYILFNIESGNEEGRFNISDGYNGKITLEKPLDFDKGTKRFELRIIAENVDATPKLNASSVLTIDVLNVDDLGTKFEKGFYEATIVKDSLVGTIVTTVQAKDGDGLNANVEYKIYQETNIDNVYKINNNTGEITVNGPLTLGITVLVVTATSTVHSPVFTVVKVTVAPMINMSFTASVPEGQSNVIILNLEPAEQFYNITGGTFSIIPGGQSGLFNIDGKNLKVGPQPLDRETKDQYQLSIAFEKDGSSKGLVLVTIKVLDINDNKPSFQGDLPYTASVREDADVGHSILRVIAEDVDNGMNGTVKYAITGGNPSDLFSIDNTTGVISLAGSLDRETTAQYTLPVQVYDEGTPPLSNVTTMSINVTDVNDNSPVFNFTIATATVPENAVNGALVIQVTANDKDIGENSKITYHILEGSYGKFIINQTSGVITTAGGLSFKEMSKYTVIVSARDNGLSPRTASALVYITITSAVYLGGAATVWAITAILVLSLGLNVLSCLWLMRRLKQDRRKGTQCTCNQRKQNKKDLKAESYDNELEMDDNMTSAVTASFSQQPTETGPEYETIQQPRENTTALDAKRSNDPSQYQGLNLTPITLAQQNQGPVYEPLRTRSVESMPLRNDNVQHSYEPLNTRNQTDDYQSLQSNSRELVI